MHADAVAANVGKFKIMVLWARCDTKAAAEQEVSQT